MKFSRLLALALLFSLTACAPEATPVGAPVSTPMAETRPNEAVPSQTQETLLVEPTGSPVPQATNTIAILPTSTAGAMQILFPTVIPEEGAEYRPPLYPVPWALSPIDHFYFARPIAATYPAATDTGYLYGGLFFGPDNAHTGIDLPAPRGTEVLAAGPGTVVWAGMGLYSGWLGNTQDPYGLAVAIRHDFGYKDQPLYTVYAHMEEIDVVVGQWVDTGDVLGNVGDTGLTTGPHLHFEVRLGENDFWETRNPDLWIAPPEGYGVLVGYLMNTSGYALESYQFTVKSLETKHNFVIKTYAPLNVNSDENYRENVVLGDLPAGLYLLDMPYGALNRTTTVEILPGQVTYFTFQGYKGFTIGLPPAPTTTPVNPK